MNVVGQWLTLAALLPVRLLGRLPLELARSLVWPLALLMRLAMASRRRVVARNLELCFPDLASDKRHALMRKHFVHLAEMLAETAVAWQRPGRFDERFGEVIGLEHLEAARAQGRGVMLITGHATCLEMGARLFGERVASAGIYRPLKNPVLEAFQNRGRARYARNMIARRDLRGMVRHLRGGGVLWYAPDQDFGAERSTFAPFFGIETATANAIVELARLGRAVVVPMYPVKDEASGRVSVHIEPAFEDFPGDDTRRDLARFNAFLERHVRQAPAQYWWLHRRFKTTPPGESDRYQRPGSPRGDS
ncbi:lipid A biosynthesis acyltransferase [Wenzhouxiangella sp. AB-CW3]|uniref:LpxL/LpxP family acyltransferase n=1 Tax=Wenzhouxiangella sp. AB-CW3 TaxID=2771012 RepID=UPI00168A4BC8|nr:lipid A biosynthesis acyltransferase [Wenzhouxiangella sp. AB-CW3]QOC21842.1 lipid A biosynthesis acyltransferase [Wenzhouxiangella sp. AB-CW3]